MSNVCIIQYDDRDRSGLKEMDLLMKHNEKICAQSELCAYTRYCHPATERPVYWEKVHAVSNHMQNNPECDIVAYLDSDAVLNQSGNLLIDPSKHFLATTDYNFLNPILPVSGAKFNAGVFAVRNSALGREIIDDWISKYDASDWKLDDENKWVCENASKKCIWSESSYEQGAFLKTMKSFADVIQFEPAYKLNNNKCQYPSEQKTAQVCHFYGKAKKHIQKYIVDYDIS